MSVDNGIDICHKSLALPCSSAQLELICVTEAVKITVKRIKMCAFFKT